MFRERKIIMRTLIEALKKLIPNSCILENPFNGGESFVISCKFGFELYFETNQGWNKSCIGQVSHYKWVNGNKHYVGETLHFYSEVQCLGYIIELWERFNFPEAPVKDFKYRPITHWNQLPKEIEANILIDYIDKN